MAVLVALSEAGYSCFGAWCFAPARLEHTRGRVPPVRLCVDCSVQDAQNADAEGHEVTYTDQARRLLQAEGKQVIA